MATHGSDIESGDGETTTFDGVSRVGGAREAGFVETRGAEDGFGRGRDAWDGRWPTPATNAVTARKQRGRWSEGKSVINSKFKIPVYKLSFSPYSKDQMKNF